ncbi:MAG: ArsR family transcriptional regulator [Candidatus Bathyarchaeota archaeon B24]|nr:MAG: ArsR family transcriptional regulator [Candidatus Bathyarchaeota archaeon B24]RLI25338.1 MAG: hypothetical protein DRO57_04255 [Candidatus Bathyarchaeota archaeon]
MKDIIVIRDSNVAKLLADKTRRQILALLRVRDMSVNQLAKVLGKPASSITHHIKCLKSAGLVELAGERRRGNIIERFYRAAARHYVVSYALRYEEGESLFRDHEKTVMEKTVAALENFGYKVVDERKVTRLLNEFMRLSQLMLERLAERQVKSSDLDTPALHLLLHMLLHLELYRDERYRRLMEELSDLIVGGRDDRT